MGTKGEFFFFSSRRRHTRYWRDWSSDVCSSDQLPPVSAEEVCNLRFDVAALRLDFLRLKLQVAAEEIGRASGRERVESSKGAWGLKKKNYKGESSNSCLVNEYASRRIVGSSEYV